jgi:bifunctional non-homologous end joining protein LigD
MARRPSHSWPPVPAHHIQLMGAVAEEFNITDHTLLYEPKYDGIRVKIEVLAGNEPEGVKIWSRQDNVLTNQFPDLVQELDRIRIALKHPLLTDGEIVAIDHKGRPLKFQNLQSRLGLLRPTGRKMAAVPVAVILFDLLLENGHDLRSLPLLSRRARLETLLQHFQSKFVRLSRVIPKDGRTLFDEALKEGWEGIIAKRAESPYRSGQHHSDWRKRKLLLRQEFVVGGWTESERRPFRALLIGVYTDDGRLLYAGRMGKAFSDAELKALAARLQGLEIEHCPFTNRPDPDAKPHWVKPVLVIEAKFNEWTKSGKLREPTFIGLRTDVNPKDVRREVTSPTILEVQNAQTQQAQPSSVAVSKEISSLLAQLKDLEERAAGGVLTFTNGHTLTVSHLKKIFWPGLGLTKADLMRHYLHVAPLLLPTIENRPLTYRPYPDGIAGRPDRYRQRVQYTVPDAVRVEPFKGVQKEFEARFIGGALTTLLYMVQLGVISQDPWLSQVRAAEYPDLAVIDLDPMPQVKFQQVVDVARWLHDELEALQLPHFLKTSGSSGLHVFMPLAGHTTFRQSWEFCELVSRLVAKKHPHQATVERSVSIRGKRVYLDYLQNLPGKTLATAYSVRANAFAGVSTPLHWNELKGGIHPNDFTMLTIDSRIKQAGDVWAALRHSKGIDVHVGPS